MKKQWAFTLLLILSILFAIPAFADMPMIEFDENFSIRGGIGYHSSKEQVQSIEEQNGNELVSDWDQTVEQIFGIKRTDLQYNTALAGHGARVFHYFNEQDELVAFHYFLTSGSYADVAQALQKKYGNSHYQSNNPAPFDTNIFVEANAYTRIRKQVNLYEYMGWLTKYNDCYVLVEIANTNIAQVVNYEFISYDEVAQMEKLLQEEDASKTESISNDL